MDSITLTPTEKIVLLEKKIYDQNQLLHISKALNSELNLSFLIESILDLCLAQLQTMQAGIYLYPEIDKHEFVLYHHYIGFDIIDPKSFIISEKESIIQYMEANGDSFELTKLRDMSSKMDKQFNDTINKLSLLHRELLLIPMKKRKTIIGIIVLGCHGRNEPYSEGDMSFLHHLASIATTAVMNARLYSLATIDTMTKLKMHHFFQSKLRENMQLRIAQHKKYLSVFLTDIDHFKKFNDTYGHQLGDLVLKEVAKMLINGCRDSDIACRYGGEEFAIILPETKIEESIFFAERIRNAIEIMEIRNPTNIGEKFLKTTVSVGIAEYNPEIDKEPEMFIERIDKALYQAKKLGRNRIVKAT